MAGTGGEIELRLGDWEKGRRGEEETGGLGEGETERIGAV